MHEIKSPEEFETTMKRLRDRSDLAIVAGEPGYLPDAVKRLRIHFRCVSWLAKAGRADNAATATSLREAFAYDGRLTFLGWQLRIQGIVEFSRLGRLIDRIIGRR